MCVLLLHLQLEELVATGRAAALSPFELSRRVLAKGKIKAQAKRGGTMALPKFVGALTRRTSASSLCLGGPGSPAPADSHRDQAAHTAFARKTSTGELSELSSPHNFARTASISEVPSRIRQTSLSSDAAHPYDRMDMRRTSGHLLRRTSADMPTRRTSGHLHMLRRTSADTMPTRRTSHQLLFPRTSAEDNQQDKAKDKNDPIYVRCLALHSLPVANFLANHRQNIQLPITSINEDALLKQLGLSDTERHQIEGISSVSVRGELGITEEQMSSRAIVRLAADAPPGVGKIQRQTCSWLLRPFPLGLRFSGKNLSPLPCWLAGAQSVALNMSNNDISVQLHFALFEGTAGYLLKPREMMSRQQDSRKRSDSIGEAGEDDENDDYWPPQRELSHRTSINVISLHNLPKVSPLRPHKLLITARVFGRCL